jgi:hypothetical protein
MKPVFGLDPLKRQSQTIIRSSEIESWSSEAIETGQNNIDRRNFT